MGSGTGSGKVADARGAVGGLDAFSGIIQNHMASHGEANIMNDWTRHYLQAAGSLEKWRPLIDAEIEATHRVVADLIPPPCLDILVQRSTFVIREIGMVGRAWGPNLFSIAFDPNNANFECCLTDGTLRRQVAHEVHHCLRFAGPGYGRTLGEALVSEGLAGQFVARLFNNPPEPWECAIRTPMQFLPDQATLTATYDHNRWFFGTHDLPHWLGYSLGFELVGRWLNQQSAVDGALLVNVPAAKVLATYCADPRVAEKHYPHLRQTWID